MPEETRRALKRRAAQHNRSMEAEARVDAAVAPRNFIEAVLSWPADNGPDLAITSVTVHELLSGVLRLPEGRPESRPRSRTA
ncbi:plasmid stability protein [Kribbella aluminosa]|uniref:Plasmid stability protein n=1 Tax=Kribbella aluminosa TaxID=416017 RepID=A0ABS4V0T2_9ACTN|nr:hypothetical protein [Kribbella aluminosa]MBP2357520.1 plasmid stability protein [Kribbella aluminosa]